MSASMFMGPRLEAGVASELNALWRSIFERARAAEGQHDAGPAPSHSGVAARDVRAPQVFARHFDAECSGADSHVGATHADASASANPLVISSAVRVAFVAPPESSSRAVASDAGSLGCAAETPVVSIAIARAPSSGTQPVERTQPAAAANRPVVANVIADETVNVFVQRGAVAIAVRNATLTDDEALRCAFETARTLVGERAALLELTLNGRTVYRQAPQPDSARSPVLVFAC